MFSPIRSALTITKEISTTQEEVLPIHIGDAEVNPVVTPEYSTEVYNQEVSENKGAI